MRLYQCYCENGHCTGREIRVNIKTYGAKDPVTLRCPLCGVEARLSEVVTFGEHQAKEERDARVNVNVQRYIKRNLNDSGWALVPLSLYDDDSLPGVKS